jgi:general stress protein 26
MTKSIADIAKEMRHIDFTMLFTQGDDDHLAGRPMSNNGEVDYDGDSYFFAFDSARSVQHIAKNPNVSLSYQGKGSLLGKPPIFIAVTGKAELIRDKSQFENHWSKGLDHWFKEGIDTIGLILIKVHATRAHYWDGYEDGDITL